MFRQVFLSIFTNYLPILPFVLNFWSHLEKVCAAKAQIIFLCGNTSQRRWVTIKKIRLLSIHRLSCNIAALCLKGCKTIAHIATTFSWITATKPLVNALLWHFNMNAHRNVVMFLFRISMQTQWYKNFYGVAGSKWSLVWVLIKRLFPHYDMRSILH